MKKIILTVLVVFLVCGLNVEAFDTEQEFKNYIISQGLDITSKSLKPANFNVYNKYGVLVYGSPHGRWKSISNGLWTNGGIRGEYEQLGYDNEDENITNSKFPHDVITGNFPYDTTFVSVSNALYTWRESSDRIRRYIKSKDFIYEEFGSDTLDGVNVAFFGGTDYTYIEKEPSCKTYGIIRTNDRSGYYQTWKVEPIAEDLTFTKKIEVKKEYRMFANENSVEIPVKITVTADLNKNGINRWIGDDHIKRFDLEFKGDQASVSSIKTVTLEKTLTFSRDQLKVGVNDIELQATAELEMVCTDLYGVTVKGRTKIIVEEAKDPYITLITDAQPLAKIWSGNPTESVAIDVESHVYGVNPEDVFFYTLKVEEEGAKAGTAPTTKTFKKTSEARALVEDNIDCTPLQKDSSLKHVSKYWVVTAEAVLKDGTVLKAESKEQSIIVRETIPVPTPEDPDPEPELLPPVVKLRVPKTVKLGDPANITASARSPQKHKIVQYDWVLDGGDYYEYANSKRIKHYFDTEGNKDVSVEVWDDKDQGAQDEKEIQVLPPTIEAAIGFQGVLKVGRAIQAHTNDTDTPERFPVKDDRTDWTVKTDNRLFYENSDIDGKRDFYFMSSDPGEIEFTVKLENTAGYQDTTSKKIIIQPDEPPVADFSALGVIYRQVDNEKKATISIFNKSYSPDNDKLGNQKVWIIFNQDNNKSFTDAVDQKELIYDGPPKEIIKHDVDSVGQYKIEMEITETYETLKGFEDRVTYLSDNTTDKPLEECIVEVDNLAPSMDMELLNKVKVNMGFYLGDFNGMTKGELTSYIENTIKPRLLAEGYELENYTIENSGNKEHILRNELKGSLIGYEDAGIYDYYTGHYTISYTRHERNPKGGEMALINTLTGEFYKVPFPSVDKFDYPESPNDRAEYRFTTPQNSSRLLAFGVNYDGGGGFGVVFDKKYKKYYVYPYTGHVHNIAIGSETFAIGANTVYFYDYRKKDISLVTNYGESYYARYMLNGIDINERYVLKTIRYRYGYESISKDYYVFKEGGFQYEYYDSDSFRAAETYTDPLKNKAKYKVVIKQQNEYTNSNHDDDERTYYDTYTDEIMYSDKLKSSVKLWTRLIESKTTYSSGGWSRSSYDRNYQVYTPTYVNRSLLFVDEYHADISFRNITMESTVHRSVRALNNGIYIYINKGEDKLLESEDYVNQLADTSLDQNNIFINISTNNKVASVANVTEGFSQDSLTNFEDKLIETLDSKYKGTAMGDAVILLQGENYSFNTMYWDYEQDPINTGGYKLTHTDANFFDNSNGTYPYTGQYKTLGADTSLIINQVGKYLFEPSVQDNPSDDPRFANYRKWSDDSIKNNIIVHRRPIADFEVTLHDEGYIIDNKSYDEDHNLTDNQKGIRKSEWKWRKEGQTWEKGLPPQGEIEKGQTYHFNLVVTDIEGAKSLPVTKSYETKEDNSIDLTLQAELKPAKNSNSLTKFIPNNSVTWYDITTINGHNDITLHIKLWNGSTQLGETKSVTFDGNNGTEENLKITWKDIDYYINKNIVEKDKTYQVTIEAIDNKDPSNRDKITRNVTIYRNNPPTIALVLNPEVEIYEGMKVKTTATVHDLDLERLTGTFKIYDKDNNQVWNDTYAVSPSGGTYDQIEKEIPNLEDGQYKLKVIVADPDGATSSAEKEFTIKPFEFSDVELRGIRNFWRGQVSMAYHKRTPVMPHRFMSWECVVLEFSLPIEPDEIEVRMSPQLEAMSYTNQYGHVYDHEKMIGYEVRFPLYWRKEGRRRRNNMKFKEMVGDKYRYQLWADAVNKEGYSLPLSDQTIIDDVFKTTRDRRPYWIKITARKGETVTEYIINDIDITGDVLDRVYIQEEPVY